MNFNTFIIAAWLTITPLAQFSDTTSVILVEFSESMSIDSLLYPGNYSVISSVDKKSWRIYRVGLVHQLEEDIIKDTSLIALVTERLPNKTEFLVKARNIKDKAGNYLDSTKTVWFYFNGFAPNKFVTPSVRLE